MITRTERKAWARERFRGFENLLVPSFSADLRTLNEEGVRLDVRQSIAHGFFASLCALDAGLARDEKLRMLAVAADEAGDRIAISLPLTGDSLQENIELLGHAARAGVSHAQVSFPQSFRPRTQDDVVAYVRALAESTDLGLYLVASDKLAFHHLHPGGAPLDAYEQLADLDNVIGLLLASMDAGLVLECFERFHDRLLVTTLNFGMLPMLAQSFGVQWSGAWTVEGLQSPQRPHAMRFMQHLQRSEFDEAMTIYWKLAPALGANARVLAPHVMTGAAHWPMLKYQQWLSGGNGGMTRQPCMRMFERDMQAIRGGLGAIGVECTDPDDAFFAGRTARRA